MRNHFHLVLETPQANLSAGMRWFLGTYTARFNRRHKFFGHLFSGRYKSIIVDGSANRYVKSVCDYVHLNPVRARLLKAEQRLKAYRWSSYPEYLRAAGQRPEYLRVDRLFGEWEIAGGEGERAAAIRGGDQKPLSIFLIQKDVLSPITAVHQFIT